MGDFTESSSQAAPRTGIERLSLETKEETTKDPRKIARKYQLDLCAKALKENTIVYLGTGCGKTHIAVLLMYELRHLITKPKKDICIFLAPTVALVHQQAKVIEASTNFKVGTYCGETKRSKTHEHWENEVEKFEVLVMTPQILLRCLYHCFIKLDLIALLIFDECHHAQLSSSHPYAEIMKNFYKTDAVRLPRIFGMTASPVMGKGASCEANLSKSLNSLEELLHAKVRSFEDDEEMEKFVSSAKFNIFYYGPVANNPSVSYTMSCNKLMEVKRECLLLLTKKTDDLKRLSSTKKMLNRIHTSMIFCLENLGLWGALQAAKILLSSNHSERDEIVDIEGSSSEDSSISDTYLKRAAEVFASTCSKDASAYELPNLEVLKEPLFSKKLLRLIGILANFRLQPKMKCIIFVKRIVTAISLSHILNNLKVLAAWKCDFLLGVHCGVKQISRSTMNIKLEKFRSGELNLLIATKVGEEGLDIQTCCLVIRFDLPENVASFIQSRGRARMPQSEYVFLVDSGNQKELELIENFRKDEDRMVMEINSRTSTETFMTCEEQMYKVDCSGASISLRYSVSLLHHYCARLPHDEFFVPKPEFYYFDDGGSICHVILPANAAIHQVVSTPHQSQESAKRDACLKAIEKLHKLGALTNYLLPGHNYANTKVEVSASANPNSLKDEDSQAELHEMLVPSALKKSWTNLESPTRLSVYYINLEPTPRDRIYKEFGLFVKVPLPAEAERMELNLHLARGRSVWTNLIPSGVVEFDKEEICLAQNFQEMYFKALLDRSELAADFVSLGQNKCGWPMSPVFYLLLPVTLHDNGNIVAVDWKIVHKCLSSPMFRTPSVAKSEENSPQDDELLLANGPIAKRDIVNSLVYVPLKKVFYFVNDIVCEKNGCNLLADSNSSSRRDDLMAMRGVHLKHPDQPLLQVKPVPNLHNLLHNRIRDNRAPKELKEYLINLPPELCSMKILGFSKDIGSSISLFPSIMHRLENLLVAIELKSRFSSSFPEGAKVTANRILEALTTENCQERFSLERLETLGDAFLKYSVGRHLFLLHSALDEGELTRLRSTLVKNVNLRKLAVTNNLQVYIRDQALDPCQFFAPGRPYPKICTVETEAEIHSLSRNDSKTCRNDNGVKCSKGHQLLRNKTISDVVEALVGAFLVDSGFKAAIAFLRWIGMQVDFEVSQLENVLMASTSYMRLSAQMDIASLETELAYRFVHKGLLLQAFIHPSYNKHGGGCYQRLEFLGDAVLDYLITSYLYSVYPKLKPGQLTDLRSLTVNNKAFANVAFQKSFQKFIICDSSSLTEAIKKYVDHKTLASEDDILEGPKCPKVLGDLVESSIGAILLDTGFDLNSVWKVVLSILDPVICFSSLHLSPVRELRELCQSLNWDLLFDPCKEGGTFNVKVEVVGKDFRRSSCAKNQNKKEATRIAAQRLLGKLKAKGHKSQSRSLEEIVKSSNKREPVLIGFNETPISISSSTGTRFEDDQEASDSGLKCKAPHIEDANNVSSPRTTESASPSSVFWPRMTSRDHGRVSKSRSIGAMQNKPARSLLNEICQANYWNPPSFECCKTEGQSHLMLFTFKVTLQIEDAEDIVLECYGDPQSTKKTAAEAAAKSAIWYLKEMGYLCEDATST